MFPNFPLLRVVDPSVPGCIATFDPQDPGPAKRLADLGMVLGRIIDPKREEEYQKKWSLEPENNFREKTGIGSAQVVCVRGNHDFYHLREWIGGDVFEVILPGDELFFHGYKISGMRGVNYMKGEWNDELQRGDFNHFAQTWLKDDVDILLSHSPPRGILEDHIHHGSDGLAAYVNRRNYGDKPLLAHMFGHCHDSEGMTQLGKTIFSNAATTFHCFDI